MNTTIKLKRDAAANRTLPGVCLGTCQKLAGQIERTKDAILAEFQATLEAHEHLLRLAVTEAEALAWQTDFPQLIFPTLAREKAQAVVAWQTRQRSTQSLSARFALDV